MVKKKKEKKVSAEKVSKDPTLVERGAYKDTGIRTKYGDPTAKPKYNDPKNNPKFANTQ